MNLSQLFSGWMLNASVLAEAADASASCPPQRIMPGLQQVKWGGWSYGCDL